MNTLVNFSFYFVTMRATFIIFLINSLIGVIDVVSNNTFYMYQKKKKNQNKYIYKTKRKNKPKKIHMEMVV